MTQGSCTDERERDDKWTAESVLEVFRSALPDSVIDDERMPWLFSIYCYDSGEPDLLVNLFRNCDCEIPDDIRQILGDIIAGKRKPNPKRIAQLKLKGLIRLLPGMLAYRASSRAAMIRDVAEEVGDAAGCETSEVVAIGNAYLADNIEHLAETFDVHVETVENLRREFGKYVKQNFDM